jgi:hypothetical protein
MPRIPFLLLLALTLLLVGAAPALATSAVPRGSAPIARAAIEDDAREDPGDEWVDEEASGDDWADEDACVVVDENGDVVAGETCDDEGDICTADDEWSDATQASTAADDASGVEPEDGWADGDDPGDDWSAEEPADDPCAGDEAAAAPPRISALRVAPARRGGVRVQFKLDRAGRVTLALERVGERGCAKHARSAKRPAAKACARTVAVGGSFAVTGRGGANATTLRRWNGHPLKPGAYKLTATPETDDSRGATASFTLRAPAHRR